MFLLSQTLNFHCYQSSQTRYVKLLLFSVEQLTCHLLDVYRLHKVCFCKQQVPHHEQQPKDVLHARQ